jgi:two-component system, cell cycle sensor histidine kinase PleC
LIDNDLPQTIESDRGKLQQILINLVNNAVRYTPDNGRISVRAWPSTDSVKILVEDDGIGMTDDEIALALKPFGQVKNAFTSDVAGTGLGLPIVVSFLDLLRGDMRIESEKGKGTSVCIRIPMRFAERPHRRGSIAH